MINCTPSHTNHEVARSTKLVQVGHAGVQTAPARGTTPTAHELCLLDVPWEDPLNVRRKRDERGGGLDLLPRYDEPRLPVVVLDPSMRVTSCNHVRRQHPAIGEVSTRIYSPPLRNGDDRARSNKGCWSDGSRSTGGTQRSHCSGGWCLFSRIQELHHRLKPRRQFYLRSHRALVELLGPKKEVLPCRMQRAGSGTCIRGVRVHHGVGLFGVGDRERMDHELSVRPRRPKDVPHDAVVDVDARRLLAVVLTVGEVVDHRREDDVAVRRNTEEELRLGEELSQADRTSRVASDRTLCCRSRPHLGARRLRLPVRSHGRHRRRSRLRWRRCRRGYCCLCRSSTCPSFSIRTLACQEPSVLLAVEEGRACNRTARSERRSLCCLCCSEVRRSDVLRGRRTTRRRRGGRRRDGRDSRRSDLLDQRIARGHRSEDLSFEIRVHRSRVRDGRELHVDQGVDLLEHVPDGTRVPDAACNLMLHRHEGFVRSHGREDREDALSVGDCRDVLEARQPHEPLMKPDLARVSREEVHHRQRALVVRESRHRRRSADDPLDDVVVDLVRRVHHGALRRVRRIRRGLNFRLRPRT